MKNILYPLLALGLLLQSCGEEVISDPGPDEDVLIFGHFFGECFGETCVETFRLDDEQLLEDTIDNYPTSIDFSDLDFAIDRSDKRGLVKSLINKIPDELLTTSDKVIGMPDAGDWGGIYVEIMKDGQHDYWLIDNAKENLPSEALKTFRDEIVAAITLINQ